MRRKIKTWYAMLPAQIAVRALKNMPAARMNEMASTVGAALNIFSWSSTEEGTLYWSNVVSALQNGATEEKLLSFKPLKRLRLNGSYFAEIQYSERMVHVGCQKIPFDSIDALYRAMYPAVNTKAAAPAAVVTRVGTKPARKR